MLSAIRSVAKATYRKYFYQTLKGGVLRLQQALFALLKTISPNFNAFRTFRVPSGFESLKGETLYPTSKVTRSFPKTLEKNPHERFYALEVDSSAGRILRLEGGMATATAALLTPSGRIIPEFTEHFAHPISSHKLFTFRLGRMRRAISHFEGSVASLIAECDDNYYHWLFDVVPKLHLLQKSGSIPDRYYVDTSKPFQRESLALLGVNQDQVIDPEQHSIISAKTLLAASFPLHGDDLPTWTIEAVRSFYLDAAKPGPHKRLFVSRRGATYRRILNENELLSDLKRQGFHIVQLETCTFLEQISLFKGAEVVIAPHGAGLANLAFCSPQTKVVEIFSPRHPCVCYWALANLLDLDYSYFCGIEDPQTFASHNPGYDDILVDPAKLQAYL